MSVLGDALRAIKNIAIMDERVSNLQDDVDDLGDNVAGLSRMTTDLDKRLYALERLFDFGAQQARQRRIEE